MSTRTPSLRHFGRVPRKTKKALQQWPDLTPAGKARVTRFCAWFVRQAEARDRRVTTSA